MKCFDTLSALDSLIFQVADVTLSRYTPKLAGVRAKTAPGNRGRHASRFYGPDDAFGFGNLD
ncbi:MAG: hypothetical protein LC114_20530 [Bryobacterales bacterium]|nr:hypothetical protein [Bryobacterales bacterium]